jgi:hypothetical protein
MHVRVQSWLPFTIQIDINGREWLCRQLAAPSGSSAIRAAGYAGYYWVTEQREIATDLMFRSRPALHQLLPEFLQHSLLTMSAEDALRFLGRKPHGRYQGETTADLKRRPEGVRVKLRTKRNSIKLYDKGSVLRVETTIHNPREFKTLRTHAGSLRWMPLPKGVAHFWRLKQIGASANARLLDALAQVPPTHQAGAELDRLSRGCTGGHHRIARFNPVAPGDARLFAAVLDGRHLVHGFRNCDLAALLDLHPALADLRRRREHTSRLIAKLRGHGLVAKVPRSRR